MAKQPTPHFLSTSWDFFPYFAHLPFLLFSCLLCEVCEGVWVGGRGWVLCLLSLPTVSVFLYCVLRQSLPLWLWLALLGGCYVGPSGLRSIEICLPWAFSCWDQGCVPPHLAFYFVFLPWSLSLNLEFNKLTRAFVHTSAVPVEARRGCWTP